MKVNRNNFIHITVLTFSIVFIGLVSNNIALALNTDEPQTSSAVDEQTQEQQEDSQSELDELQSILDVMRAKVEVLKKAVQILLEGKSVFVKTARLGSEGEEIRELQEFLSQFPELYPEGLVTGYFGQLTEAAVKRFQVAYGIEANGIVGTETREQLHELIIATAIVPLSFPESAVTVPEEVQELKEEQPVEGDKEETTEGVQEEELQEEGGGSSGTSSELEPVLFVDFSATPSSGTAPLNGVDLAATVSGTAIGEVAYQFYCTWYGALELAIITGNTSYTADNLCSYQSAGTYTATVSVQREGVSAQGTAVVAVVAPPPPVVECTPLTSGKQTYFVSTQNQPQLMQVDLDPLDVEVGATQIVTVKARDINENSITVVSGTVQMDNGSASLTFSLISGTDLNGTWEGSFVPTSSLCSIYTVTITALSASGSSKVDVSLR